jgi:hypothetical protein
MPNIQRMVNLGDSVPWGQGLAEADKYDVLVMAAVAPAGQLTRPAHSGATIGPILIESGPADGEVPVSQPTILDQCNGFNDSPETVDLVLVNGGINDVDLRNILNPLVPTPILSALIRTYCHDSMLQLLKAVAARFSSPTCRILVTGYYPILSDQSKSPSILGFLGIQGIAPPPFLDSNIALGAIASRCQQFFEESTTALTQAAEDAGDARIAYVDPGFTGANSVFAPQTLLWGVNDDPAFSPQDEVVAARHASCDLAFNEL